MDDMFDSNRFACVCTNGVQVASLHRQLDVRACSSRNTVTNTFAGVCLTYAVGVQVPALHRQLDVLACSLRNTVTNTFVTHLLACALRMPTGVQVSALHRQLDSLQIIGESMAVSESSGIEVKAAASKERHTQQGERVQTAEQEVVLLQGKITKANEKLQNIKDVMGCAPQLLKKHV